MIKIISWLLLLGYMGLIFFLSSLSNPFSNFQDGVSNIVYVVSHIVAYMILGFLLMHVLKITWGKAVIAVAFIAVLLYGISDEIHQIFVEQRNASISDLIADCFGGVLGIYIYKKSFVSKLIRRSN